MPEQTASTVWWCNFCNYRTTDPTAYLRHSCAEELKKQPPQTTSSGGKSHCR